MDDIVENLLKKDAQIPSPKTLCTEEHVTSH